MIALITGWLFGVAAIAWADGNSFDPIRIPQARSTLSLGYTVSIHGRGSSQVGNLEISKNIGHLGWKGQSLLTFIQRKIPWPDQNLTLYQAMAVDSSHWFIYWVYCDPGNQVTNLYYEGVSGPTMASESAEGTCQNEDVPGSTEIDIPQMDMSPSPPVSGYPIIGKDILLESGKIGHARIHDEDYDFLPFGSVDCSKCGNGGWQELHSIFIKENEINRACFAIIYLRENPSVLIKYSLCLPDLSRPLENISEDFVFGKGVFSAFVQKLLTL